MPFVLLALVLCAGLVSACAPRPGPEVLNPVAAAPGARTVTVYAATTRARLAPDSNAFGPGRALATSYAAYRISIPPGHQSGKIEWPQNGVADPATTFATLDQAGLSRAAFERDTARKRVGVFVHGYNYNFQEGLFRLAQMAGDAHLDGVPVLFSWPSEAKFSGYAYDRESVTLSRDALVNLLTLLAREPGRQEITVFGHSMGGWLVAEAVRQLRLMGRNEVIARLSVVLAAPDIDVDVFRAQMQVIGPLPRPMVLLVSKDDVALSLSRGLAGERQRVGALDVNDPRVQEAARAAHIQIVDISGLNASDGFNHDRFVALAALYPSLSEQARGGEFRQAGAFVFNTVGNTLSAPFGLVGQALAGN